MVDAGSVGRAGYGGYKSVRLIGRVLNQRKLLWHLRYQAVANALESDARVTSALVDQAAKKMCEALSETDLPIEQSRGVAKRASQWTRENVTRGVRYPEFRGGMRTTFWQRLYVWAKRAAETSAGGEALTFCGFVDEDRGHIFAARFTAETYALLLDAKLPDSMNTLRHEMAEQILHGYSDEERDAKRRRLRVLVTSASTSAATTILSYLGFNTSLGDTAIIGSVTFGATAAVDVVHGGLAGLSSTAAAARRQVRNWLMTLSAWMIGYVAWGEHRIRDGEYQGVDQLVYVLRLITEREIDIAPVPKDEAIFEDLRHLMDIAERAGDGRLVAGLMDVQGALLYRRDAIPIAIGNLISIVQDVPELPTPTSRREIDPGSRRVRLPFAAPDD